MYLVFETLTYSGYQFKHLSRFEVPEPFVLHRHTVVTHDLEQNYNYTDPSIAKPRSNRTLTPFR